MIRNLLFVTGAPRTGTSLTLRLLASVADADAFSQPLPLVLVELKRAFLRSRNAPDWHLRYPLADQIFETAYPPCAFAEFLARTRLEKVTLKRWLEDMRGYSGQYFKPDRPLAGLEGWREGLLADFANFYFRVHGARGVGPVFWKETFGEEYLPYLIDAGAAAAVVVRDPRDSITSQLSGRAEAHAGTPRPLLYLARQWRKSAAYALAYRDAKRFSLIRYEDLVVAPERVIGATVDSLGLPEAAGSVALDGWLGNSSFGELAGVSAATVGRFRGHLDLDQQQFIEALCFGEMKSLGYQPELSSADVQGVLECDLKTDYLDREELSRYAYTDPRKAEELERHASLTAVDGAFDPTLHLFETAFKACRGQLDT